MSEVKRLTDPETNKVAFDTWELCGLDNVCQRDCWKPTPCKLPAIVRRLAAYEDIGSPEEFASLRADAASYQQVKNVLSREGFTDIETMIARFKQVMVDENETSAARELEMDGLREKLKVAERTARNARNELCQKCGRYREAHKGACDGCKWANPS